MTEQAARVPIERSKSLTAIVVERLRSSIIDGTIPLGSLLSEKTLAESYGVSKTPVREALVQLQADGLVAILPQRGGLVFLPDAEQVRELCEVRLELETAGLRLSFERARDATVELLSEIAADMRACFDETNPVAYQELDSAFHTAFFTHCGNSLLARVYETFNPRICALRTHLSTPQPYLLKKSYEEHLALVDLLAAGHLEAALEMLQGHVKRTQNYHSRALPQVTAPQGAARRRRPAVKKR